MVLLLRSTFNAQRLHASLEDRARRGIQLLLHQMAAQMNHADVQSEVLQAARGLQPQQAAADHRRASSFLHAHFGDFPAIVERAEHKHARLEAAIAHRGAFHRRNERPAAGGDDQLVVRLRLAVLAVNEFRAAQQTRRAFPGMQTDIVFVHTRRAG